MIEIRDASEAEAEMILRTRDGLRLLAQADDEIVNVEIVPEGREGAILKVSYPNSPWDFLREVTFHISIKSEVERI